MAKPYTFSFSYSRWSDWSKCPAMFKYKYIDKVDTGPTPKAMLEGRKVHDDVAHYIEGKLPEMPDRLSKNFSKLGGELRQTYEIMKEGIVTVEKQMAFDRILVRCQRLHPFHLGRSGGRRRSDRRRRDCGRARLEDREALRKLRRSDADLFYPRVLDLPAS